MQILVAGLLVVTGAALGVAAVGGLLGRLPRNRFVGVRTPATLASDEAFRVGNRVAGAPLLAAAGVAVLGGLVAPAAPSLVVFLVIVGVCVAGVVGLMVAGGVLGTRAAESVRPVPARSPCAGCACGGPGSSACVR
ncbi:MAG TPA: SdpI family protein [Pseudonocardiaceae bacterium]